MCAILDYTFPDALWITGKNRWPKDLYLNSIHLTNYYQNQSVLISIYTYIYNLQLDNCIIMSNPVSISLGLFILKVILCEVFNHLLTTPRIASIKLQLKSRPCVLLDYDHKIVEEGEMFSARCEVSAFP